MNKQTLKTKLKYQAKNLAWRAITTVILTLTAVVTFWVYAAFVEPGVGPNSSDQDFAQNILGNNDANNDFTSSSVVANADGSLIERQEYVQTGIGTSTDAASMSTTLFAGEQYIVDSMSRSGPTFIYVTSATTNGNIGGRSGADTFCKTNKPTTINCSNIHAFISVSATDEIRDMPGNYGYDYTQPVWWFRSDGTGAGAQIGTSWVDILDNSIITNGTTGTGYNVVSWTGSLYTGELATTNTRYCNNWTTSDGANYYAKYSSPNVVDGTWINFNEIGCHTLNYLLCACTI